MEETVENSLDYAFILWRIPWVAIGENLELCLEEVFDICIDEVRGLFLGEALNVFEEKNCYRGASLYKEIPL